MSTGRAQLGTLRRISRTRRPVEAGERCEMCSAPVAEEHPHVVDVVSRGLLCTCRPCYLLFTDQHAEMRYRAVPDRYLAFPGFRLDQADWDDLQIPVGLVFLFRNSVQDRLVAFSPSPAGATESELALDAWQRVLAACPGLETLVPDVEAVLVRGGRDVDGLTCHIGPLDAGDELVGRMRQTWRGVDGGQEARAAMAEFFAVVEERSRPAEAMS